MVVDRYSIYLCLPCRHRYDLHLIQCYHDLVTLNYDRHWHVAMENPKKSRHTQLIDLIKKFIDFFVSLKLNNFFFSFRAENCVTHKT